MGMKTQSERSGERKKEREREEFKGMIFCRKTLAD